MWSKKLKVVLAGASLMACSFAHAGLLVDRGLPTDNLNNISGSDRSNVAWEWDVDGYYAGDTFTVGSEDWHVDTISTWVVAGSLTDFWLGDRYESLELYFGEFGSPLNQLMSGSFTEGTNDTDNGAISISQVGYDCCTTYQGSGGGMLGIYQIDWVVDLTLMAHTTYGFGVDGDGRGEPQYWFNHASNAERSGTAQDGADGLLQVWQDSAYVGTWDSQSGSVLGTAYNGGWDKSSDINIQVFGSVAEVPEPSTIAIFALALAGLGAGRIRKRNY